jgi:hypothetical protein
MNSRGQAALEYLMTYGWALVIIVVVAGILFFIISSPSGGVSCSSNDPTKFPVVSSNVISTDSTSEIKLTNGTGGQITVTGTAGTTPFVVTGAALGATINATLMTATGMTKVVGGGASVIIVPDYGTTTWGTTENKTGSYTVTYTDQFGYTGKSLIVTCQGMPKT